MWFEGPISEAVTKTKAEKTLLIVFICGTDEKSTLMKKNFETEKIRNICQEKNCVALKLEDKSEAAKQFAVIYPLFSVPSSYFIGINGRALEIVADPNAEILEEKLNKCLELHEASKSPVETPSTSKVPAAGSDDRQSPQKNLDEKIALAQELIKKKNEAKIRKDEEDARANEMKRRQEGKGVNEARERLKEQEIITAAEERRNDKKADKAHLQKLREQIAADRAEKMQNFVAQRTDDETKNIELVKQKAEDTEKKTQEELEHARLIQMEKCKTARIQYRLPDGSASSSQNFDADQPFLGAFRVAEEIANMSGSQFRLVQMFPRREFTADDLDKSFKDLNLVPSAVLMILPDSKLRTNQVGWLQWITSFMPFSFLNWLYSFFFGAPRGAQQPIGGPKNKPGSKPGTFGNQQGNIRRMPGTGGDSNKPDDNATWNGNSTQQL